MKSENTDPRLTAHALGELHGEELEKLEAELAEDEHARDELEAIRSTSALLERELGKPSGLKLEAKHLERITSALGEKKVAPPPRRRRLWAVLPLAAALPLLLFSMLTTRRDAEEPTTLNIPLGSAAPATNVEPLDLPMAPATAVEEVPQQNAPASGRRGKLKGDARGWGSPEPFAARPGPSRESYDEIQDNPFVRVDNDPRSTFSIDVDTASYALVRRFLNQGQRPPKGAVRIEELVNYFTYSYPEPRGAEPFSLSTDLARAPWAPDHRLLRIGLKAKHVAAAARKTSNLVFLIDVSGSMNEPNKLPLVKDGLTMLARQLDARDHVSIVVYAGASGLVLPPTAGSDREEITSALDRLQAGGSTNGGEGIELAYAMAARNFEPGGVNRVILATDGDFNVGVTNQSDLIELIERKAKTGVFLSVLGFGQGNYQDSTLEKLADKGNGNYAYIDSRSEAHKVLVEQASGTLITVAKDVKIQLEFNPREVEAFRLIGYENRKLSHQAFNDDRKDAGEIGADHTVTALYELIPAGGRVPGASVDALKYQKPEGALPADEFSGELLQVKLRYKLPSEDTSQLIELPVRDSERPMSADFRFASAVAELGMLLRDSPHKGQARYAAVLERAGAALGDGRDRDSRREFIELVRKARDLADRER
ncbi:MAG TPA: VWA domain-containing protein [Polyangiaceae bacterium]|nr:VWA domain-containing protein [Polyangiaceae bacterium]